MTEEEKKQLQEIIEEINKEAKNVVEDYVSNPSEMSGSAFQIHETSPYLDEMFKEKAWKKIIKTDDMEGLLKRVKKHNKKLGKKKKD